MNFDADQPMADDGAAGDNVLIEVAPARPRGPPPNIGKKPVSKKPAAVDDGDDDASAPAPKKVGGPPARLAGRSTAAAASGPVKVIKADDI